MMAQKRKKFIYPLLLLLGLVLLFLPNQVSADSVDDQAGLFTDDQITLLNQQAAQLNEQSKSEVFVVTTTTNTEEPRDFADDYLRDQVGNNNNGAVLLMDMGQRQIYISTSGNMIYYLTDTRRDELLDSLSSQMSNGDYFATAQTFLKDMSTYVEQGMPDGYSVDEETGKVTRYKTLTGLEIGISIALAVALGAAFFIVTVSRYQLKIGGYHYPFNEKGTVNLTEKQDHLVHSFVTTRRIPRPTNNGGGGGGSSTHSSGGGTFGGGGRGF